MKFRDVEGDMTSGTSSAVTEAATEKGRVFYTGVNIVGVCSKCGNEVYCSKGSTCCGFDEFPCPRQGCDGCIENPDNVIFFNCSFQVEYDRKEGGKYTGTKWTTKKTVPSGEYMYYEDNEKVNFFTYRTLEFHTS